MLFRSEARRVLDQAAAEAQAMAEQRSDERLRVQAEGMRVLSRALPSMAEGGEAAASIEV